MKTASASSRSAARAARRRRSTGKATHRITTEEFDRRADLRTDDPDGDITAYLDLSKARRPGRVVQRVNVDFPVDLLAAIDQEVARIGVPRQAFIKLRMADAVSELAVHDKAGQVL